LKQATPGANIHQAASAGHIDIVAANCAMVEVSISRLLTALTLTVAPVGDVK